MATSPPPEAVLAVIEFADGWRIVPGGSSVKSYAAQKDAISAARRLIALAELSGRKVQLLVHDTFGELRRAPRPPRSLGPEPRQAADRAPPARFFPANQSDADLSSEMGGYPALLVMRLRAQSPWWVSRPEPGRLGETPGNDR